MGVRTSTLQHKHAHRHINTHLQVVLNFHVPSAGLAWVTLVVAGLDGARIVRSRTANKHVVLALALLLVARKVCKCVLGPAQVTAPDTGANRVPAQVKLVTQISSERG